MLKSCAAKEMCVHCIFIILSFWQTYLTLNSSTPSRRWLTRITEPVERSVSCHRYGFHLLALHLHHHFLLAIQKGFELTLLRAHFLSRGTQTRTWPLSAALSTGEHRCLSQFTFTENNNNT